MNTASVLYWLYATLNHDFGNKVSIQRDALRNRYSVNKYGIEVKSTGILLARDVTISLKKKLLGWGYSESSYDTFTKVKDGKNVHISISQQNGVIYIIPKCN